MIVETLANEFYAVSEINDPNYSHVWTGQRMKKDAKYGFVPVKKIKQQLIRKEGCKVVQS